MLRISLAVLTLLVVPATAQAQFGPSPTGTLGELPLSPSSGCLTYSGGTGICADAPAPDINTIPPVSASPGAALTVRFDHPLANLSTGQGTLTRVDAHTWTFALPAAAVGPHLVALQAQFAGPQVAGSQMFHAHVAVASQSVSDARLKRGIVRAKVRVPARGAVRAHVVIRGKRRSAVVKRAFSAAGERRLRLDVRRGAKGTAWLVTRYTFPGARAVEVSQRLPG
jgi:hypothetical protein